MAGAQNSSVPPAAQEYGGDEVSAIVLDPGWASTRSGFAGEDVPKSVVPTQYGVVSKENSQPEYFFGDNALHNPSSRLDIKSPFSSEGIVEDWDLAARVFEYSITSRLTGQRSSEARSNSLNDQSNGNEDVEMQDSDEAKKLLHDNPLLLTEPGWNPTKAREKCLEIAMEDWGSPAFWLGRTGVMAAFAAGKPTALVVDVGAATTAVTPVLDGFMVKKGVVKSNLAGNFVSQQLRLMFAQSQPQVPLVPHFTVSSKTPVDAATPAQAVYRNFDIPVSKSFRRLEEERVLTEFKESVVQLWGGPGRLSSGSQGTTNEDVVKGYPGRPFEMPDGWNQVFGAERFKVAEGLFDAKAAFSDAENPAPKPEQTIPELIQAALAAVDVENRPTLLANVVVTGGSSLLYGFTDRLNSELQTLSPAPRTRISAPGNTVERKFASWIGGSILSSLGSFQQMWISKKEYEEHGASIIEKRCK